jgi:DNA-directed RNA polymerase I, II, and III subunit RPABC2
MSDYESESEKYNSESEEDVPKKKPIKKPTVATVAAPSAPVAAAAPDESDIESDLDSVLDSDLEDENGVSAVAADTVIAAPDDESDMESEIDDLDEDDVPAAAAAAEKRPLSTRLAEIFREDEENNDTDFEDETYLQKFNDKMKKNIIEEYYPELIQHNYDEVDTLCNVLRDELGNICDPFHKTLPILTKYEKTRIVGERARQIESGAPAMVDIPDDMIDAYLIAMKELEEKKIPFIIKRPLPNGVIEYWRIADLEVL